MFLAYAGLKEKSAYICATGDFRNWRPKQQLEEAAGGDGESF
jgi:hypothetical protein